MKRRLPRLAVLVLGLAALAWVMTGARQDGDAALAGISGNAAAGETVFFAAGCRSCHTAPGQDDSLVLAGGQSFKTPFGTFIAPNITPHPEAGIGNWRPIDLHNALRHGTSPDGRHYYPVFPYDSYARMTPQDVADLHAYLMTLPADATTPPPHDLGFPFSIRRTVAGWKFLYLDTDFVMQSPQTPEVARGRYLVEALGHCGACHTPRTGLGGPDRARWLEGAPNATGPGKVPGITPGQLDWSEVDIAYYLESGFTPDFDSAGGHMAAVVRNMGELGSEDRAAIAAYLKALP